MGPSDRAFSTSMSSVPCGRSGFCFGMVRLLMKRKNQGIVSPFLFASSGAYASLPRRSKERVIRRRVTARQLRQRGHAHGKACRAQGQRTVDPKPKRHRRAVRWPPMRVFHFETVSVLWPISDSSQLICATSYGGFASTFLPDPKNPVLASPLSIQLDLVRGGSPMLRHVPFASLLLGCFFLTSCGGSMNNAPLQGGVPMSLTM